MDAWRHLLGGMLLWTVHFFTVYGIASLFPGTKLAAMLVLVATGLALALAAYLLAATLRHHRTEEDNLKRWRSKGSAILYALAGLAILYQGLPALLQ
ncbi:hypothetical protein [Sphingomonas glaciei]|uniref:Uncharacterized protein n=1 Tax=Sphingomonas glaciei TaxID=2938948 RepID=A0ABY5MZL4_9SPHN|nr:hypothetical protein [Sphingomonas glaciei]UUR08914.1 hypothetical protein M1K48_04605 [Sphingomonas glaciei]